jgi:hypothetical protein
MTKRTIVNGDFFVVNCDKICGATATTYVEFRGAVTKLSPLTNSLDNQKKMSHFVFPRFGCQRGEIRKKIRH